MWHQLTIRFFNDTRTTFSQRPHKHISTIRATNNNSPQKFLLFLLFFTLPQQHGLDDLAFLGRQVTEIGHRRQRRPSITANCRHDVTSSLADLLYPMWSIVGGRRVPRHSLVSDRMIAVCLTILGKLRCLTTLPCIPNESTDSSNW